MSAGIYLTAPELDALHGLSHLAARLYPVLRRHMDFATGLVGKHRRISYQALREECETVTPRGAGWQREQPTIKEVRVALSGLFRHGLVEPAGDFIFKLPLAHTVSTRPNQTGQSVGTVDNAGKPVSTRDSGHTGQATPRQTGHTSKIEEKHISTVAAAPSTPCPVDNAGQVAAAFLERLSEKLGYPIRYTLTDPHLTAWVQGGLTFDQVEQAALAAKAARERDGSTAPLNPGFIAAFIGQAQASAEDWRNSWSGIVAKGAELGITQQPGEIAPAFKARVFATVERLEVAA